MSHLLVGWAVVGLGSHARARFFPALQRSRKAKLLGVYTRNEVVKSEVASKYAVRGYETFEALLADPEVDIVYLATPNDLHAQQTLLCTAAGKHVLVEKPMALSVAEAASMVDASARANVKLFVGFQLRHHPAHLRARALIAAGEIGDIVYVNARWAAYREPDVEWRLDLNRAGGTLLTARGVHLIDLIRFVTSTEYVTVVGLSDGLRRESPVDNVTLGIAGLRSGGFAHFLCTRLVRGAEDGLEIYGTRGTIVTRSTVSAEAGGTMITSLRSGRAVSSYHPTDLLLTEVELMSAIVGGLTDPDNAMATGTDGLRTVAVTTALLATVETGKAVNLEERP